jgi:DNA repair protein SbcC/Rad50
MILTSLRAENVLKYERLALDRLPAQGVVAISGYNESGKSSIGETICFALFGRTFSLDGGHIAKIVRWGETRCTVAVGFRIGDTDYRLTRSLDNDGNHSARLALAGDEANPIARGPAAVAAALEERLGYDFNEFIESFYLAQREITTPHPHSEAVKIMAGLAPLERVTREFQAEIAAERRGIEDAETKIAGIDGDLADLAIDPQRLPHLEEQRDADAEAEGTLLDLARALEDAKTRYALSRPAIKAAKRSHAASGRLAFLLFLVTLALGGAWAAVTFEPDHVLTQQLVNDGLGRLWPDWAQHQATYLRWIALGAVGAGALFLIFLVRRGVFGARLRKLRETCGELADALTSMHLTASQLDAATGGDEEEPAEGASEPRFGSATEAVPEVGEASLSEVERPDDDEVQKVARLIAADECSEVQTEGLLSRELAWVTHLSNERTASLAGLGLAIDVERDRRHRGDKLDAMRRDLVTTIDTHRERITVRERAVGLLNGAAQQISHRFNRDVRNLVGKTLPLFTDGRYEHLQIDNNLNVRVFSADKRDFMDLDEISSGTQRQIMLALRLALSQQLLDRTVKGAQFVFLDEPFAFFDEARTRRALAELPALSTDLQQILIVAQAFPRELAGSFALHLECAQGKDEMVA